jgi:hypothetical protein
VGLEIAMIAAYPDYEGRIIVDFAFMQMDEFDTQPCFVLTVTLAKMLLENWDTARAESEAAIEEAASNPEGIFKKKDD